MRGGALLYSASNANFTKSLCMLRTVNILWPHHGDTKDEPWPTLHLLQTSRTERQQAFVACVSIKRATPLPVWSLHTTAFCSHLLGTQNEGNRDGEDGPQSSLHLLICEAGSRASLHCRCKMQIEGLTKPGCPLTAFPAHG